ncbi:uncharacterized protein [Lolium perenne]|uniref:uncharacterized protein n=1 Tax=Lolium perenne TaxID=4522 RepID=UPI0021F61482|nr:uncharacterized protein LOC127318598 [Lolium perenne]
MPTAAATTARRPLQKAASVLRWLHLLGADIVAYALLAARWAWAWAVGVGTATPSPRRLKQEAVAALRCLYFLMTDIVVYGSLAALWAAAVGGVLPEILGRWVCGGEDSAVTAAAEAVLKASKFVLVRFFPGFIMQFAIRFMEFAQFEAKERRDKLATSSSAITAPSAQRQRPERKGVQRLLPLLGMSTTLLQLGILGMRMKNRHQQGSVSWKIGYVLSDVAALGSVALTVFVLVPNMLIIAARFPGRRLGLP